MSYKNKKAQGLSLTFKEEFDLSKLFISSYADNKININNINYDFPICIFGKKIFEISKYCKFFSFKSTKLLSINVKKVKKPRNSVILDRIIMIIFFFKNSNII